MEKDNSDIIKDKNHYESISDKVSYINNKLLEDRQKQMRNLKEKRE